PQQFRGFRQVGARLGERQLQDLALGAGPRRTNEERLRLLVGCRQAKIVRRKQWPIGHYNCTFYTIFELADVSGPSVILQRRQRPGTKPRHRWLIPRRAPP